jgi:hypothetical protein
VEDENVIEEETELVGEGEAPPEEEVAPAPEGDGGEAPPAE